MTPNSVLDTNERGLALIKRWEGFRSRWYQDVVGIWTVGYGTTEAMYKRLRGYTPDKGQSISASYADKLLVGAILTVFEPVIERNLSRDISSNAFSALSSFSYNVGGSALASSRLLRLVNQGDMEGAAREFGRWVYAGGRVYEGLVRRRKEEAQLFLTPDDVTLPEVDIIRMSMRPPESVPHEAYVVPATLKSLK